MSVVLWVAAGLLVAVIVVFVVLSRRAKRRDATPIDLTPPDDAEGQGVEIIPAAEAIGADTRADDDWIDREATAGLQDADRRSVTGGVSGWMGLASMKVRSMFRRRTDMPPAGAQDPSPETPVQTVDYDRLQRDLGLKEQTGGALAIGLMSLVVVVLIGVWLVGSTHHGPQPHVHFIQVPIQGPQGPQGSLPP